MERSNSKLPKSSLISEISCVQNPAQHITVWFSLSKELMVFTQIKTMCKFKKINKKYRNYEVRCRLCDSRFLMLSAVSGTCLLRVNVPLSQINVTGSARIRQSNSPFLCNHAHSASCFCNAANRVIRFPTFYYLVPTPPLRKILTHTHTKKRPGKKILPSLPFFKPTTLAKNPSPLFQWNECALLHAAL